MQAFHAAENLLLQHEREVLSGSEINTTTIIDDDSICGIIFYRVTASTKNHGVVSELQSVIAKLDNTKKCDVRSNIVQGRQSFLVIE